MIRQKMHYNFTGIVREAYSLGQHLSPTSRMVLALLRQDSRRTATDISLELGVSRTTVAYHIARLTQDGTIRRFTIDVDQAAMSEPYLLRAMFDVVLSGGSCLNIYPFIAHWTELVSCWSTSGSVDMRILVEAATHRRIDELRDRLGRHPNVGSLTTSFVLRTFDGGQVSESLPELAYAPAASVTL